MSSNYIKNASSNRDALFGSADSSKPKKKSAAKGASSSSRPQSRPPTSSASSAASKRPTPMKSKKPHLSADAIATKTKQAQEFATKANNCMKKSLFSSPDPVAASTYFKRAADCYKSLGEATKERLYRVESALCNRQCNAWATAAADYTRAAELAAKEENDPTTATKLHVLASECWRESGESAKAAGSQTAAAVVLLDADGQQQHHVSSTTLTALEAAVEAHVPDLLNPTARYRQTGTSLYDGADRALAQHHLVTAAYAHEAVQSILSAAAARRLYPTALYAAGAISTLLSSDGVSTISLARAFWAETVLYLALGDPVAAEEAFMNRHLQVDSYLRSRECAAAEDLIRAVQRRDAEALDELRTTQHRAAIANLPPALQPVVMGIRVSGVAKVKNNSSAESEAGAAGVTTESGDAKGAESKIKDIWNAKTGYEDDGANLDGAKLDAELDGLHFDDDDDDELAGLGETGDNELNEMEDDDIDLR